MRLDLSLRAEADLHDIRDYSVDRFGATQAVKYLDAIEQAFRRILGFPQIGVAHERLRSVRSLPVGEHRVYYKVSAETVTIVRVLHKAMDVARHL